MHYKKKLGVYIFISYYKIRLIKTKFKVVLGPRSVKMGNKLLFISLFVKFWSKTCVFLKIFKKICRILKTKFIGYFFN